MDYYRIGRLEKLRLKSSNVDIDYQAIDEASFTRNSPVVWL